MPEQLQAPEPRGVSSEALNIFFLMQCCSDRPRIEVRWMQSAFSAGVRCICWRVPTECMRRSQIFACADQRGHQLLLVSGTCPMDSSCPMQAMGIQRYIFFSIHNAEKHPEVPLMQVKTCTEKFIQQTNLNYTVFRLCGFMQVCLYCCTVSAPSASHAFSLHPAKVAHIAQHPQLHRLSLLRLHAAGAALMLGDVRPQRLPQANLYAHCCMCCFPQ